LLLAADILFLWMFFAADSITLMVLDGRVSGGTNPDLALAASRYAAQWKHGMAGNSPLYMPGFFAVGVPIWLWSIGRPLGRLTVEWIVVVTAATVVAAGLAPLGATRAIRAFEHAFGVTCVGAPLGFSPGGAALSLFTLFTWSVDLISLQLMITRRNLAPAIAPVLLNLVMVELRPWAVNDFTTQWIADLSHGNAVAVLSLLAVPASLGLLVRYQVRRERAAAVCGIRENKANAHLS
jgi:hypothetical protein